MMDPKALVVHWSANNAVSSVMFRVLHGGISRSWEVITHHSIMPDQVGCTE